VNRNSVFIIGIAIFLVGISVVYFFSLPFGVPLSITALFILLFGFFFFKYIFNITKFEVQNNDRPIYNILSYFVLCFALFLLTKNTNNVAEKYGGWDAWWFWNYRAKYFTDNSLWNIKTLETYDKDLLVQRVAHADYPPGLSSLVAFFWRLFNTQSTSVPFCISFLFAAFIPVLLFIELHKKNLLIASIIILWLVTNENYILEGTLMLSDIWISFFLLATIIGIEHYRASSNPNFLILSGASLGCSLWTKNEALLLLFMIIVFYGVNLLQKNVFRYFIIGLIVPMCALFIFKIFYATPGDLFVSNWHETIHKLTDIKRYETIWSYFIKEINIHYNSLKKVFLAYLIICFLLRKLPSVGVLFIISCITSYFMVYSITPHNLDWHVSTSIDRLVLHLAPALVYVLFIGFSKLLHRKQIIA
jgi:hypothetical protein